MTLYHISAKKLIKRCAFSMFTASLILCSAVLSGCSAQTKSGENAAADSREPISATEIKLNTVVTVTIYDSQDRDLLTKCMNLCDKYEKVFSRTAADSELYKLNHRKLTPVERTEDTYQVSDDLAELISEGLDYSELSKGAFDIAIEPLTSLWLKDYLISQNVKSAIINLGGNVLCIGGKPDNSAFKIGIQKPFADRSETIAVMDIRDKSVVSSGIYERCFEQDGILYHHLLNPKTGYPYDNGLIAVTIISDKSVDGDALSTTCFALGLEDGMKLAESLDDVQAFFVTSDYEIHYTRDFQKKIKVTETE